MAIALACGGGQDGYGEPPEPARGGCYSRCPILLPRNGVTDQSGGVGVMEAM